MNAPVIAMVGMVTIDYLYVLESHPVEGSTNAAKAHRVVAGGPAGRSAIAAGRLGGDVRVLGMCGNDLHADVLRGEFAREPLSLTLFVEDQPSQHSCVMVAGDSGSRTIIWTPQPRADQRLLDALDDTLRGAAAALLDCTDPVLSRATIDSCRKFEIPVIIDTGSYRESSEEFLDGVDYIIAPEKFFSARHPEESLEGGMRKVYSDFRPTVLAATRGELGGIYLEASDTYSYDPHPVPVVDSCGAGDTFHGAFTWAIASGASTDNAFRIASWAAARKCSALGNDGLPDAATLSAAREMQTPNPGSRSR
ncbi:PfkB family carbohydrate kinase [Parafrankia sp. FMc6]|uniref:PfkB family carbohydrate kinase n=1 Tax=Parafrankia soli TaxID=2599596 RepID=UPI0034D4BA74